MRVIRSLVIAFATYSRIPMPRVDWADENRKYTMCFFPLIGAVIGAALWLWLWVCDALSLGALLRGVGGAMIPLLITGGIHMDGFMDTCDAIASWQTKERRLEILKDSHVGAFAVIGFGSYLAAYAAFLSEARPEQGALLLGGFMISRALSAWALTVFKSARPNGMLDAFARTAQKRMVGVSSALYLLACVALWFVSGGWLAPVCLLTALVCVAAYRSMAYRQFGGVTGDLAGWFVQVTELALAAAIVIGGKLL